MTQVFKIYYFLPNLGVRHTPDSYRDRKEKDTVTGYSYPLTGSGRRFGARYYDSDLSMWLSVDPMADKYPSMSSYMYTEGNPIMLIDPNGMETIKRNTDKIDNIKSHIKNNNSAPTTPEPVKNDKREFTRKEYVNFWENSHGEKMNRLQKNVLKRGCIGVVEAEINTSKKPDLTNTFDDFIAAQKYAEELKKQYPNSRIVLFAFEFYSHQKNRYLGDPITRRVDFNKRPNYLGNPNLSPRANFNYTLFDSFSGSWWGANHSEPNLIIFRKNADDVIGKYNRQAFNRQVFSVTIANP